MKINAGNNIIDAGYQLDNNSTVIAFPIKDIISEMGTGGSWGVRIQRYGDSAGYPSTKFVINGDFLELTLTSVETSNAGDGNIQLCYTTTNKTSMTQLYKFHIHESLCATSEVPTPWISYVELLEQYKNQAQTAAANAQNFAEDAEDSAERCELAEQRYPTLKPTSDNWWLWDVATEQYVDSGHSALGPTAVKVNNITQEVVSFTSAPQDQINARQTKVDGDLPRVTETPVNNTIVGNIKANYNDIKANSRNISTLTNTVDNHQSNIESLSSTVNTHTTSIGSLSETVSGHSSSISTLDETVSNHTTSISTLSDTVSSHGQSISSIQTTLNNKVSNNDFASKTDAGIIKIGDGITIDANHKININPYFTTNIVDSSEVELINNNITSTNTSDNITISLSTPVEGIEYNTGLRFKSIGDMEVVDSAPSGYSINGDAILLTSDKYYEIIYKCLWLKDTDNKYIIYRNIKELF